MKTETPRAYWQRICLEWWQNAVNAARFQDDIGLEFWLYNLALACIEAEDAPDF